MPASLRNPDPEGKGAVHPDATERHFEQRILDKLDSSENRLGRIEGKPPRPAPIPPLDMKRELAGLNAHHARLEQANKHTNKGAPP